MRQGYGGEKGPPPYLLLLPPLPASSLGLSKLDFILQKQSGMNNSFSTPSFCFFSSSVLSLSLSFLTFVLHSSSSCRSWSLFLRLFSPFLPNAHTQNVLSPLLSCSVGLGDLCFSHLPAWLNPPVCVVEPNAVIRMITICPPTSLWRWISIHHQVFASVTPCPVYWSGLTDHICPITQL